MVDFLLLEIFKSRLHFPLKDKLKFKQELIQRSYMVCFVYKVRLDYHNCPY